MDKSPMTITNFYNNVKYICKSKGMQIGDLEKKVGISPGYLSRLCSESKELSVFKAYKIATILEWDLMDLLETEVWKEYRTNELKEELAKLEGSKKDD